MITVIKPLSDNRGLSHLPEGLKIALFGSIEMGSAIKWQQAFEDEMNRRGSNAIIFNPRRDDWDSSWGDDHPELSRQISWELFVGEEADVIVVYFDPTTKAPISLMELGMAAKTKPNRTIVCCPEGYWRRKNVQMVCERYGIEQVPTLDDIVTSVCEFEFEYERIKALGAWNA